MNRTRLCLETAKQLDEILRKGIETRDLDLCLQEVRKLRDCLLIEYNKYMEKKYSSKRNVYFDGTILLQTKREGKEGEYN
ncbi:MAG: hypothetical protein QXD45_06230 [Candidatus Bathyarchaeia archaeon]